jgi:HPt (histidine-containing phosphotransfer) domain-containing protein
MDDYISKPVLTRTLSHMLDKWVAHPINQLDPEVLDQDPAMLFTGERDSDLRETSVPGEISVNSLSTTAEVQATVNQAFSGSGAELVSNIKPKKAVGKVAALPESSINIGAIDTIRAMQRPGKDDLLAKIIGAFFVKTRDVIEQMQGAANDDDVESVVAAARGLGTSSAYLGAERMSSLCKRIELVAAENGSDELTELVFTLAQEYESVTEQLNTIVEAA